MIDILIVEDDIYIGDMLEELLTKEKYKVIRAYSGTEALLILSTQKPKLILLDLMLPGLSGEEVLLKIQSIPTIILSAKIDVDNKVKLLLDGAVDYITKPFNTKELLARIVVHLRHNTTAHNSIISFDEISLDITTHIVTLNSNEVKLTRTEYAILKLLIINQTQVVTKSVMLDNISEDTPDCTDSSLKIHISNLRKKLRSISGKDYIEAVWGIGFKLQHIAT